MPPLSFVDLPGEIRNQIYLDLLTLPDHSTPRPLGDRSLYPQILSTCRQVHEEAKQILYGLNTFLAHHSRLASVPRLREYYDPIFAPRLTSLIRKFHIRVRIDCDPNFSLAHVTDAFSGVEELTIQVSQSQYGSSNNNVLRLFEGVRAVKRARVYGSITLFREYVEWLQNLMMAPRGVDVGEFVKDGSELSQHGGW